MRLLRAALTVGCVAIAALSLALVGVALALGWSWQVVMSGSMAPSVPPGSLLLVQPATGDGAREGDVVTYRDAGRIVTHRVVEVIGSGEDRRLITKGDANAVADPVPLSPSEVEGRIQFMVPRLGAAVNAVDQPVVGPMLLLLGAGGLVAPLLRNGHRRARSAPA